MFESMTLNKKEHLKNMHFGYSKFSEFSVPDSLVTDTNGMHTCLLQGEKS